MIRGISTIRTILTLAIASVSMILMAAYGDARPRPSDPSPQYYVLGAPSAYEIGCYGPCECPARPQPIKGTFRLRLDHADALTTWYVLEDLRATVVIDGGLLDVTGTGSYRIGGEFTTTQRLTLHLTFAKGLVQDFDSGSQPGHAEFPAIAIAAAAHGFACHDSVMRIVAKPGQRGGPDPHERGLGAARLRDSSRALDRDAMVNASATARRRPRRAA